MAYINQLCRHIDTARALIGTRVTWQGESFECADHNDLGVLYWQPLTRQGRATGKLVCDRWLDHLAGSYGAY